MRRFLTSVALGVIFGIYSYLAYIIGLSFLGIPINTEYVLAGTVMGLMVTLLTAFRAYVWYAFSPDNAFEPIDVFSAQDDEKKVSHRVDIVPFKMEKHPNADSLSVVQVYGYTCVVRTADWEGVTLAAYIPPDSVVDTKRPAFAWLATEANSEGKARIKAKKLRGIVSFGCLVKAPDGSKEGDDVAELLGVEHFEPPIKGVPHPSKHGIVMGGEQGPAPHIYCVKYDVEALRRYHDLFVDNEPVFLTEKADGSSSRYVYWNNEMYCGSRTEWKVNFQHIHM